MSFEPAPYRITTSNYSLTLNSAVFSAKVHDLDAARGAAFGAGAAVGAFFVVDDRHVVYHLDRAARADLFALFAADTADGADLARESALVAVAALDDDLFDVGNKRYQTVGTGFGA